MNPPADLLPRRESAAVTTAAKRAKSSTTSTTAAAAAAAPMGGKHSSMPGAATRRPSTRSHSEIADMSGGGVFNFPRPGEPSPDAPYASDAALRLATVAARKKQADPGRK
jgi:hypothetical protein